MITASDEIGVADWLVSSLFPFQKYVAGSVVPPGYEAYVRIHHPTQSTSDYVSWARIADWAGRVYHPAMQFEAIATPIQDKRLPTKPWDGRVPNDMPMHQAKALANLLGSFTATPEKVWYLVWEGYGDVPQTSGPRVQRPHRNYLLYCGGIDDIGGRGIPEHHREPPEYWFPEDKSWCVATDMDLFWTYIGGSRACIDAILNSPDLETVPAELNDGLTVESDEINLLSDEEKSEWGIS